MGGTPGARPVSNPRAGGRRLLGGRTPRWRRGRGWRRPPRGQGAAGCRPLTCSLGGVRKWRRGWLCQGGGVVLSPPNPEGCPPDSYPGGGGSRYLRESRRGILGFHNRGDEPLNVTHATGGGRGLGRGPAVPSGRKGPLGRGAGAAGSIDGGIGWAHGGPICGRGESPILRGRPGVVLRTHRCVRTLGPCVVCMISGKTAAIHRRGGYSIGDARKVF